MAFPVNFDPAAAIRIYNAVRKVEAGDRDQKPLTFRRIVESGGRGKAFRMATFTGAWSINSSRTVRFYGSTSTSATVSATNIMMDVPSKSTSTETPTRCAIANDRGTWFLLQVEHANLDVLSSVSLQPTSLQFSRSRVAHIGATIATAAIAITECDNESASAEQLNWFLG